MHLVFNFILRIGWAGPLLLGIADSSFLVLPFGNDLLLTVLIARHHALAWGYAPIAAAGSVAGIALLDLVCRSGGEARNKSNREQFPAGILKCAGRCDHCCKRKGRRSEAGRSNRIRRSLVHLLLELLEALFLDHLLQPRLWRGFLPSRRWPSWSAGRSSRLQDPALFSGP